MPYCDSITDSVSSPQSATFQCRMVSHPSCLFASVVSSCPEFPVHPPAKNIEAYVESYAKNFNLLPHVEFSTSVDHVERDEDNNKWTIFTHNTKAGSLEHRSFSRIVVATGILNVKNMPTIEEIDKFAGDAIHSRQFKGASKYKGKNVLVVGFGSTGADTTSFLSKGGANKVYLSHRGRVYLVCTMISSFLQNQNLQPEAPSKGQRQGF